MARVELPVFVKNSATGVAVPSASILITQRATGLPATWYTTETGGSSSTAAVLTDASGRATAWLPRGAYVLTISGIGFTPTTQAWDAMPASDLGGDGLWFADGAVTNAKVASGVDATKFTVGLLPAGRVGAATVPGSALVASAVALAELSVGTSSKLLLATRINAGSVTYSPGFAAMGNTNVAHNNKPGVAIGIQMYRGTSASGTGRLALWKDDGYYSTSTRNWSSLPEAGLHAILYNYPTLSGIHTWNMLAYTDNSGETYTMDGHGVFLIFEQA